jgi:secondary thiamine-phosphate synthase enzyme
MKTHTLSVKTSRRSELLDISDRVAGIVAESGVADGVCYVYVPHTTAGVTINENADPSVRQDIIKVLDRLVPWEDDYAHSEGNSAAHVKASMMGFTATIPIEAGRLTLGTWQGIYFCEFDGPRTRQVVVKIVSVRVTG